MASVVRRGRGSVFFGEDFRTMARPEAVRQALSRLARAGTIRRIGTGLYHYPAINEKLGGELPPATDTVAQAIARRTGSRVVATGAQAANLLGLSTQVPAKPIYLTNGSSRSVAVAASLRERQRIHASRPPSTRIRMRIPLGAMISSAASPAMPAIQSAG